MGQAASSPQRKPRNQAAAPKLPRSARARFVGTPIDAHQTRQLRPQRNGVVIASKSPVKRVLARNVKVERLAEPPKDAAIYYFESSDTGRRVCWKIGSQTALQFLESSGGVTGADLQFFKGTTLRVFFPTRDSHYITKTFKNVGGHITLEKVLKSVEATATAAIAHHLQNEHKQTKAVTTDDVARVLKNVTVCHILLRRVGGGNQVYVRVTGLHL